jgi:FkbH-like protein
MEPSEKLRIRRDWEETLRSVDQRPTLASYTQAARAARAPGLEFEPIRVAYLSSFTIDSLVPFLQVEAARQGFLAEAYVGPFNSVRQELLDPTSGCCKFEPEVVFVAQLLGDTCPSLESDFLALTEEEANGKIEASVAEMESSLKAFRARSKAVVVLHNFALPAHEALGVYEAMAPASQTEAIRRLNARLVEVARTIPGVHVLNFDRICAEVGYANWLDPKMWLLGRAPLSARMLPEVGKTQAAFLHALRGSPRKCLVLDLDNTLWGGIVGESGVAGIKLGNSHPGNIFRELQKSVLNLHRRGILLAINSKNNLADVEEVFRSHPDMVLKREHFAAIRANWQAKPDNMVEIARELNIGLNSLVFFDDNPAEREQMRQALPQVLTLDVPADPQQYILSLHRSRAFERLSFTAEDRERGAMYQAQADRKRCEKSAESLEEFLRSLEMEATIRPVDAFAFPRVLDLIQKTNQFNLTTRRHSEPELDAFAKDPRCGVFSLQLRDRFGDNGIVGAAIVLLRERTALIETFLLSCRVIGRTVESAFLAFLADWAKAQGATLLEGEFIPSAKNAPAADFYSKHGFSQVPGLESGSVWRLDLAATAVPAPLFVRVA